MVNHFLWPAFCIMIMTMLLCIIIVFLGQQHTGHAYPLATLVHMPTHHAYHARYYIQSPFRVPFRFQSESTASWLDLCPNGPLSRSH